MPKTRALLADAGVTFENSFSPYPLCCPARSSFLTGLYTAQPRGVVARGAMGLQGAQGRRHSSGRGCSRSATTPSSSASTSTGTAPSRRRTAARRPRRRTSRQAGRTGVAPSTAARGRTSPTRTAARYRFFNTTLNDNGEFYLEPGRYQSDVFGDLSSQIIADNAGDDRPFFFWANYVAPHHGQPGEPDDPKPIKRDDGGHHAVPDHRPAGGGAWPVRRGPHRGAGRGRRGRRQRQALLHQRAAATQRRRAVRPPRDRPPARRGALGRRRPGGEDDRVRSRRAASSTRRSLRSPRDNGYFLGEHRIRQGKILPYEPALAVPLLVRGPGIPAGEVRTDPFTSIDFAPTIDVQAAVPQDQVDVAVVEAGAAMLDAQVALAATSSGRGTVCMVRSTETRRPTHPSHQPMPVDRVVRRRRA